MPTLERVFLTEQEFQALAESERVEFAIVRALYIKQALRCDREDCRCQKGNFVHCPCPNHRNGDRSPSLLVVAKGERCLVRCPRTKIPEIFNHLYAKGLWHREYKIAVKAE